MCANQRVKLFDTARNRVLAQRATLTGFRNALAFVVMIEQIARFVI